MKTTEPKPLYDAAISYRTPSGRKVRYGSMVAAETLSECESELRARLANAVRFGRRRVAVIVGEFSATFITMQIGSRT